MTDENNFRQNLYKYLDGELPDNEIVSFKAFLEANPLAKIEYESEKKLDDMIRNHMVKEEAPYELRECIIRKLHKASFLDAIKVQPWFRPVMSGMLTLVIAFVFMFVLSSNRNQFPAFAQAVETHVDFLQGCFPHEIKTNNIDEAIGWFNNKLDFAVTRPHISSDKATLVGARIIQIDGKKAAYFMYKVNDKKVSAFVLNMEDANMHSIAKDMIKETPGANVYAKNIKGFETVLCYHKHVSTGCLFVTDMTEEEFVSFLG